MLMKRKPARSREFRRNNEVIDFEEARERRRQKQEERLAAEAEAIRRKESKKVSPRKQRQQQQRRVVYTVVVFAMLLILGSCVWNVALRYFEKQEVAAEQEKLLKEKERAEETLANVNDPEYVEQEARRQLHMIKPGETLFILPTGEEGEDSSEAAIKEE